MGRQAAPNEHFHGNGSCQPPLSQLGVKILREDLAKTSSDIVGLTIQLREFPHGCSKFGKIAAGKKIYEQHNRSQFEPPIYRELYDSASSILTEILRQPRLIVEAIASTGCNRSSSSSISQTTVGFIIINRILHPYFTNSSSTTSLLFEAVIYQSEGYNNSDSNGSEETAASLFIDNSSHADAWSPLVYPLPVTPNVQSETVLTTILKLYAVRLDVTTFFRNLWSPVLPSIAAIISNLGSDTVGDSSSKFKSIVKVALRLLSHTFSEKSITTFPPPAVAVSRALYTLYGNTGVYIYLIDLLILPNLVKILSLCEYDSVGINVVKQFHACYTQKSWWSDSNQNHDWNPVSSLIWMVWRLFTGAAHMDNSQLSALTCRDFFSNGHMLDISSMPDQRLQNILSTLKRSICKTCQLLLHLSLDAKGCETFDIDAMSATTDLKTALPHLAGDLDRRLSTLLEKPNEIVTAIVISRYEASTFFDAVSAAAGVKVRGREREGDKLGGNDQSKSLLKEEIASYHLLEGVINDTVPLSLRPRSEEMVLHILSDGSVPLSPDKEVGCLHMQLSKSLILAKSYEEVLHCTLKRLQQGRVNRVEDLIDEDSKMASSNHSFSASPSSVNTDMTNMSASKSQNDRVQDPYHSPTQTSAQKILKPHRGVVPVIRAVDRVTQQRIEDEVFAEKKAIRLLQIIKNSQVTSSYTGSKYTKVDENLINGHLLDDTKSRTYQPRTDDSSMTSTDRENQFISSLRNQSRVKERNNDSAIYDKIRKELNTKITRNGLNISQSTFSSSQTPLQQNLTKTASRRSRTDSSQRKSANSNRSDVNRSDSNGWIDRKNSERLSSSIQSKRSASVVKPFPEHLRIKLRQQEDSRTSDNKDYESQYENSERGDDERHHRYDEKIGVRPYGGERDVASPLLDSPHYGISQFASQYEYTDGDSGSSYEGEVEHSHSIKSPGQRYKSNEAEFLDHRHQPRASRGNHSIPNVEGHRSRGRESREQDADGGRNLEVEFHNHHYDQQRCHVVDYLPDVENLAAMESYYSAPKDMDHQLNPLHRPSSRGRAGNRSGGAPLEGTGGRYGYLESELEMFQNAPSLPYSTESHLGRLEGRLLTRTKSFECKLSAARADAVRPPSPSFKQPVFRPWGRDRSISPDKRRVRTFSGSFTSDGGRRSSSATSRLNGRSHSAPPGNRTGTIRSSSDNRRRLDVNLSENRYPYLEHDHSSRHALHRGHLHQRTDNINCSTAKDTVNTPYLLSSPSFNSPIGRSYDNGRYGVFSRPLSAGSRDMVRMRSRTPELIGAEEYLTHSEVRGRQLQPSKPLGHRLSGARPVSTHRFSPSPSTLSDIPSKFLREIHAGVTPGLREDVDTSVNPATSTTDWQRGRDRSCSRERERSKPVFRPSGAVREVSLKNYDEKIAEHLSNVYKDTMKGKDNIYEDYVSNYYCEVVGRDPVYSSDTCTENAPIPPYDNNIQHDRYNQNDAYKQNEAYQEEKEEDEDEDEDEVDHGDIRAAALEVIMNMSFKLSPCKMHEDTKDEGIEEEVEYNNGEGMVDHVWAAEIKEVNKGQGGQVEKDVILTQLFDEESLYDDGPDVYLGRTNSSAAHQLSSSSPKSISSSSPILSSTLDNSNQEVDLNILEETSDSIIAVPFQTPKSVLDSPTQAVSTEEGSLSSIPVIVENENNASPRAATGPKSIPVRDTAPLCTSDDDVIFCDNPMVRLPANDNLKMRSPTKSSPIVPMKFKVVPDQPISSLGEFTPTIPSVGVIPPTTTPAQTCFDGDSVLESDSSRMEIPCDISAPNTIADSVGLAMLKAGVLVTKHGTRGKPKKKILKYVEDTSIIQWASIATVETADPKGTAWHSQVFNCSPKKRMKISSILVASITDIHDKESNDMKKDSIKKAVKNLGPCCCLVVTKERTLDLTFKNRKVMSSITVALRDLITK